MFKDYLDEIPNSECFLFMSSVFSTFLSELLKVKSYSFHRNCHKNILQHVFRKVLKINRKKLHLTHLSCTSFNSKDNDLLKVCLRYDKV